MNSNEYSEKMRIVYCINSTFNVGGMEKILQQKANYLADVKGYDVLIITTDQQGKSPAFAFSDRVRCIDLAINYGDSDVNYTRNIFIKTLSKVYLKAIHKKKLTELLLNEKPDIVITMFNNDIGFIPSINDGSMKIAEYHFTYSWKLITARSLFVKWIQKIRLECWKRALEKFDRFVVLTHEDKELWGDLKNIEVIPNFVTHIPNEKSRVSVKRVISVGRYEYQKGFDRLIKAWSIVAESFPKWHLDIYGQGVRTEFNRMIKDLNLDSSVTLHGSTSDIGKEYLNSSLYVMSSRYEGLPMVLLEAMSYGLPIVSFCCQCGPRDIVKKAYGTLVDNGDIEGLAQAMKQWLSSDERRIIAGHEARKACEKYTQDAVMEKWIEMFTEWQG